MDLDFSWKEIIDLATSVITLSLALTLASSGMGIIMKNPMSTLPLFSIYLIVITPAFILHEMGHRFMAKKYGAKAHYQGFPNWILFMLLGSILFRVVFAATGAVVIFAKYLTPKERADISLAGAQINIILAILSFISLSILGMITFIPQDISIIINMILSYSIFINAFLATFNLVPIYPLDGSKVMAYSFIRWIKWFGLSVIMLLFIRPESLTFILFLVMISLILSFMSRKNKLMRG